MKFRNRSSRIAVLGSIAIATGGLLAFSGQASAEPSSFEIEAGQADMTLKEFGRQSRLQTLFDYELVRNLRTQPVNGALEPEDALRHMLSGTGLAFERVNARTVAIRSASAGLSQPTSLPSGAYFSGRYRPLLLASLETGHGQEGLTLAQAPDQVAAPAEGELEEVVVRSKRPFRPESSTAASKLELDVKDTPQALTVLGSEFLDIADLKDTASVIAYTAGLEATGVADGTESYVIARGFLVDRYRSFRINGLSVYSEIDVDYYAMDRVEFVRGPASSLYGEADYGATVNRVLKAPTPDFGASVGMQFGSYDFRRVEGDVRGGLNSSGTLSGRVVGVLQDSSTFIDGTENNRWLIAPSLRYELDQTELLLQAYYTKVTGSGSDGFALIRDENGDWALPDVPIDRNYGASTNNTDSSNAFYFARLTHRFTDTLKTTVMGGYSNVKMNNDSSYLCDCDGTEGDGIADLYLYPEHKRYENTSFDIALEKSFTLFDREQRVVVSADWRQMKGFQPYPDGAYIGSFDFVSVGGPYPSTQQTIASGNFFDGTEDFYGASFLSYLKPTDRLSVLLGMRYSGKKTDWYEYYFGETIWSGEDEAWVPRAGLVFKLNDAHNLFLSYSEGIIFNDLALDADRNPINPEQGVQFEAGFKGEFFADRLFYSLSAFTIDRKNRAQVIAEPPGLPAISENIGSQTHRGIDLEVQGEPVPGFNIYLSYAYLDVTIEDSPNFGEIGSTPGHAPKNSLSMFANYEVLGGSLKGLSFGGGFIARSEREIDNYRSFQLPAYERFDLRLAYEVNDRLLVELNAKNVLGEEIPNSAYEAPQFGIQYTDARSVIAGASYRF